MKKIYVLFICLMYGMNTFSQQKDSIRTGEWTDLSPTRNIRWITQDDNRIFAASNTGMFTVNKNTFEIENFSKSNILSDVIPVIIESNPYREEIIIYYENANIDLVTPEGVFNLPDIKNNRLILGGRNINSIKYEGTDFCLLATAFGFIRLNTADRLFDFTVFTGFPVKDIIDFDGYYWVAGERSLHRIRKAPGTNYANFLDWEDFFEEKNLFLTDLQKIEVFNSKIYFGTSNGLFKYDGNEIVLVHNEPGFTFNQVRKSGDKLLVGAICDNFCPNKLFVIDTEELLTQLAMDCVRSMTSFIQDQNGRIWVADLFNNLTYANSVTGGCQTIVQNRPPFPIVSDIAEKDGILYFTGRGARDNFSYSFSDEFFFTYDRRNFKWYNQYNVPFFQFNEEHDVRDLYLVCPDPNSDKIYFASYLGGLVVKEGDTYSLFDKNNSILQGATGDDRRTRISGLGFDEKGNLWINNTNTDKPLVVLTPEGEWYSYSLPVDNVSKLIVAQNGFIWMLANQAGTGIVVFDPGEGPGSGSEVRSRMFSAFNSELESDDARSIKEDLNGNIWVGTSSGITVFECGNSAFENICRGSNRVIVQDDFGDLLIGTEVVKSIAVDGANRKWLGTTSGIFVQSGDGSENIASYNAENSPLISNDILNLEFIGENLLYISTNSGLQVLKTDATFAGNFVRESNVVAYPNPVHPEYKGIIYIKGLAKDSNVKITDIRGRIVHETRALGGQASWNGNDQSGRRAASGVYYIFSTYTQSFENPVGHVAKILLLN